jgi:thymidylate synthase
MSHRKDLHDLHYHPEHQYLNLLKMVLREGTLQSNRTKTRAWTIDGAMMQFNMREGFPVLTTKKLAWQKGFAEQIGFLRGLDNAQDFADLGCDWWFKDANENSQWLASPYRKGENDLGRIYGVQWRKWRGKAIGFADSGDFDYKEIDQVQVALDLIRNNPTNRRIIINAWRPDEFDQMALPPCHVAYEFMVNVERNELNMSMWQRSCDMFLGVPMNIANSALMLHLFSMATGMTPGRFTHFLSDVHIYENHVDQVREQLTREPLPLPTLGILSKMNPTTWTADDMAAINPKDICLPGYVSHPGIRGEMSTG